MSFGRKLARRKARLAADGTSCSARPVAGAPASPPRGSGEQKLGVINVSAFWKDDMPGGLRVGLRFQENPEAGTEVCRILQRQLDVYDAHGATPDLLLDQLCGLSSRREGLSNEETIVAITNIYWLQERGHVAKDEHNGVLFAWTVEGTDTLAFGEENPVAIDHARAMRDGIDVTEMAKAGPLATSRTAYRTILDHVRTLRPSATATGPRR